MISADPTIRLRYKVSGNHIKSYGVLILSKFDCLISNLPFKSSRMQRNLLVAEPIGANFVIATAHFESLNSAKERAD
jgi:hypothetical protein